MNPNAPAIEVTNLRHRFGGRAALDNVTFSVAAGSIHGFVGPNGAGKTTSLKVIGTLLKPQQGKAKVFGMDVVHDANSVRRKIGFMPDHFASYRQMTVFEYLDFFAAAYGQNTSTREKTIGDVLSLTDMLGRRDDMIKGLSRGMQQRLALARVLVHDPALLLLDEPASGLDPRARIELMDILRELKRLGKTVFISSHILSELGDLCDAVTIMDRGTVKFSGTVGDLLRADNTANDIAYVLAVRMPIATLPAALKALGGVISVDNAEANEGDGAEASAKGLQRLSIHFDPAVCTTAKLLTEILACGADVVEFREELKHLHQAFMDLTTPGVRV